MKGARARNWDLLEKGHFKLTDGNICTENTVILRKDPPFYVRAKRYRGALVIEKIDEDKVEIVENSIGRKSHIKKR